MPRNLLTIALAVLALGACQSIQGPLPPQPPRNPAPSGTPQPEEHPSQEPSREPQPPQPQRQFRLGAASSALVSQAQKQSNSGDTVAATATLERALRIEPDNPLLWIELGRLRLQERNPAQAQSFGRKALALATGDAHTQSSAWQLIAEALRAQGRNQEASEAQQRAAAAATPLSDEHAQPDRFLPGDEAVDAIEEWAEALTGAAAIEV